jgi:hypothetical protein
MTNDGAADRQPCYSQPRCNPNPAASLRRGCPTRPPSSLTALSVTAGHCVPWADAARTAPGILFQPTLRIGSTVTLSTHREFRRRLLENDDGRELVPSFRASAAKSAANSLQRGRQEARPVTKGS